MKFKKEHLTPTELGEMFGVSEDELVGWLEKVGLHSSETKRPSCRAHDEEYCKTYSHGFRSFKWLWNAEKTVNRLVKAGHHLASPPPSSLVEPSGIKGPFTCRSIADGAHEIIGEDGFPVVSTVGDQNAKVVTKLLNLAHGHGVFDQKKPAPPERIETDGFVIVA